MPSAFIEEVRGDDREVAAKLRIRIFTPKNAAIAGIVLASASGFVLLFAGFGGAGVVLSGGRRGVGRPQSLARARSSATLGMAAAVWAYRETAGEPSG